MRHLPRIAAALAAVALLAGCSHASALRPVSPDQRTKVRFATIDVLENEGIDVRVAPSCRTSGRDAIRCEGSTADGRDITSTSPADDSTKLIVTVDGETVYSGPLADVLQRAAEAQ